VRIAVHRVDVFYIAIGAEKSETTMETRIPPQQIKVALKARIVPHNEAVMILLLFCVL
ncbi:MAG: hypothetical protein ACI90V_002908, partial [Bacillariaceae sp.]|jgi:hypothetical protein